MFPEVRRRLSGSWRQCRFRVQLASPAPAESQHPVPSRESVLGSKASPLSMEAHFPLLLPACDCRSAGRSPQGPGHSPSNSPTPCSGHRVAAHALGAPPPGARFPVPSARPRVLRAGTRWSEAASGFTFHLPLPQASSAPRTSVFSSVKWEHL